MFLRKAILETHPYINIFLINAKQNKMFNNCSRSIGFSTDGSHQD